MAGFRIPNEASAFDTNQAEPDSIDFDTLAASFGRTGVIKGFGGECAVTWSSALIFNVATGDIYSLGKRVTHVPATTTTTTQLTLGAAHASLPRFDLIVITSAGLAAVRAGTAATNPVFPALTAGDVVLAAIYVPANETTSAANRIVDKRILAAFDTVSGKIGSLTILGHSYSAGTTQSDSGTSNPWQESLVSRLQALLGIQDQNVLHLGIAGANIAGAVRTFGGWRGVLQFVMPSNAAVVNAAADIVTAGDASAVGGASAIIYGVSDVFCSLRAVMPDDETVAAMSRKAAAHGFRTAISRLRAGVVYTSQTVQGAVTWPSIVAGQSGSSGVVFSGSGSWADQASVGQNSGSAYKQNTSDGAIFTITLPQNFLGGWVAVCMIAPGASVTHLNGSISSGQANITVFDRREFGTSGTVILKIDDELLLATVDADLTWAVTRGVLGTAGVAHSDLAVVTSSLPAVNTPLQTSHRVAWTGTASGVKSDSGTANAAVDTTNGTPGTLTDTREAWVTNEWAGYQVLCNGKWMVVASNTSTVLTGTTAWVGGDPGQDNAWTLAAVTPLGGQGSAQSVFAPSTNTVPVSVVKRFLCTAADAGKTIIGTLENKHASDTSAAIQFDSWWIESNDPPPCVIPNVHDWAFTRNYQFNFHSQEFIVDFNAAVAAVVSEFDSWVRIADLYSPYRRRNGIFASVLANEATSTGVLFVANDVSFTPTVGMVMAVGGFQASALTEHVLITAVSGSYPNWTLSLTRGVNGTTIGPHGASGTANAAVDTTNGTPGTLTDSRVSWVTNEWVGRTVICNGKRMVIASNTNTILTGRTAWVGGDPGQDNAWVIGDFMGPMDWMALDGLHLNNRGHAVYAEAVYREFLAMPTPAASQLAAVQGNWSQTSQLWSPGMVDNEYLYTPCSGLSNATLVQGKQYAVPIWIARTCILTEIGLAVGTAGTVNQTNLRFGIYFSDPSRIRPGPLIQDFGTAAGSAGENRGPTGCYQMLRPGWYWLSVAAQGLDSLTTFGLSGSQPTYDATHLTDTRTPLPSTNQWSLGIITTATGKTATVSSNTNGGSYVVASWTGGTPATGEAYSIAPQTQPNCRDYVAGGLPYPSLMSTAVLGAGVLSPVGISKTGVTGAFGVSWGTSFTQETAGGVVPRMYVRLRTTQFG